MTKKGDIKLNNKVKMKLTGDEKIAHSNLWHTHQEGLMWPSGQTTFLVADVLGSKPPPGGLSTAPD